MIFPRYYPNKMVVIRKAPKESKVKNRTYIEQSSRWLEMPITAYETLLFLEVSWPFPPGEASPG